MSTYTALSTTKLPDPPIDNAAGEEANDHFNTVTYSGTSGDKAVTGVGFQPDWVWIKQRNSAADHQLYDSVRGVTKLLESNATTVEQTKSEGVKSFDSDGFTHGVESAGNDNSGTHVAWNWNAGGTSQTATYVVKVVSDSGNKYRFDDFGTSAITLELSEGGTYRFDQSDSSNSGHPLRFSTTSNGTHGGGSEYTTGVTTNGTPGSAGAYTEITVAASAPTLYYYCTNHSAMGGQANTPSTKGYTNVKGTIQSKVVVNSTAGFSIISYTGTGSNATVGHGLGAVPEWIIFRDRNVVNDWGVYHVGIGNTHFVKLNETLIATDEDTIFNDTTPTSSVISLGSSNLANNSSQAQIAYCFSTKEGYSAFGSYEGNGDANGPFIYTGFRVAWLMIKNADFAEIWPMFDNKRDPSNLVENPVYSNLTSSESAASSRGVDFLSNGFKIRGTDTSVNRNGDTHIYMAFAEQPFKFSNAR